MTKSKVNLLIDGLMFLSMAAMTGLAFLMKYVMPPGPDRLVKYGRQVQLSFLGMDRHGWGTIHLSIGLVFLGLLALHIILHWKITVAIYRKLISGKTARAGAALIFLVASVFLLAFPFFVEPQVREGGHEGGHGRAIGKSAETAPDIVGGRGKSTVGSTLP